MHGELYGISSGSSEPVYARAAILNEDGVRPALSGDLLVEAYRRFKRGDDGTDIVLVSSDADLALLVALPPGLILAGIIAEEPANSVSADVRVPIISGLGGARQQVSEGDLVILDPDKGRVLVEPDAEEFARLQADRNRRPRLHIDASHVPARTHSGRVVDVWATVDSEEDLALAIASGADGIVIGSDSEFLRAEAGEFDDTTVDKQVSTLLSVADRIGRGAMTIAADPAQIDPAVVLDVASRCALRWAIPVDSLLLSPADFRAELEFTVAEQAADTPSKARISRSMPSLTALVDNADVTKNDLSGFDEVLAPESVSRHWTIADTFSLPPIRIIIEPGLDGLPAASALGAAGVVVSPDQILSTKDFVRSQEY